MVFSWLRGKPWSVHTDLRARCFRGTEGGNKSEKGREGGEREKRTRQTDREGKEGEREGGRQKDRKERGRERGRERGGGHRCTGADHLGNKVIL